MKVGVNQSGEMLYPLRQAVKITHSGVWFMLKPIYYAGGVFHRTVFEEPELQDVCAQSTAIHSRLAGKSFFSGSIVTTYAPSAPMRRLGPKVIFGSRPVSYS